MNLVAGKKIAQAKRIIIKKYDRVPRPFGCVPHGEGNARTLISSISSRGRGKTQDRAFNKKLGSKAISMAESLTQFSKLNRYQSKRGVATDD